MEGNVILLFCVMFPFVGAFLSYGIGRKNKALRDYFADVVVTVEFALFLWLFINFNKTGVMEFIWKDFCGLGIRFTLDGFQVLYGLIAAFMWLVTTVFSREYLAHYRNRNRYYLFVLLTLGATIGVFLSADLYTTFVFFEIMSFTSYVWVVHDETEGAVRAAGTYLAIAVIGGLVMLMGLFLLYHNLGTLRIDSLRQAVISSSSLPGRQLWAAGICLLFGFGAKAGAFPLHIWLPKAHPVAPAPASALLSGILTKAGIFGILVVSCRIFWHNARWNTLILSLGVITMFLGAVLALCSVNIKRTLACSSLSQIGFIMVGIGMAGLLRDENMLAVRGSLLHMVNHSLIKLVLFTVAGVIYMNLHKLDLNEIRGFGRNKPLLHFIFLAGALGISGVPFFNGYVSKTLLHESIVEYKELLQEGIIRPLFFSAGQMTVIEWVFLVSGGLTAAYMTKLYICVFIEKNNDTEKQQVYDGRKGIYMNRVSAFVLTVSASVMVVLGMMPSHTMDRLADLGQGFLKPEGIMGEMHAIHYFSLVNVKGACISLIIGALVYVLVVRKHLMCDAEGGKKIYCNRIPEKLDLENIIYRPLLLKVLPFIGVCICRVGDSLAEALVFFVQHVVPFVGGVICRIGDCMTDSAVVLLRKSVYRDSPLPHELMEGTPATHMTGSILDHIVYMVKRVKALGKEEKPQYRNKFEHKLSMIQEAVSQYNSVISRSMSFGLLLFCIGFLATMLYLLLFFLI